MENQYKTRNFRICSEHSQWIKRWGEGTVATDIPNKIRTIWMSPKINTAVNTIKYDNKTSAENIIPVIYPSKYKVLVWFMRVFRSQPSNLERGVTNK